MNGRPEALPHPGNLHVYKLTDSYPVNGRPEALDLILVGVDVNSTGGE